MTSLNQIMPIVNEMKEFRKLTNADKAWVVVFTVVKIAGFIAVLWALRHL